MFLYVSLWFLFLVSIIRFVKRHRANWYAHVCCVYIYICVYQRKNHDLCDESPKRQRWKLALSRRDYCSVVVKSGGKNIKEKWCSEFFYLTITSTIKVKRLFRKFCSSAVHSYCVLTVERDGTDNRERMYHSHRIWSLASLAYDGEVVLQ